MKLIAVTLGQYGGMLRYEGQEFEFHGDEKDIPSWAIPKDGYSSTDVDDDESFNINRESQIISAVTSLDPTKDEHWTSTGKPRVSAVEELAGFDMKAEEIHSLCPEVTRD